MSAARGFGMFWRQVPFPVPIVTRAVRYFRSALRETGLKCAVSFHPPVRHTESVPRALTTISADPHQRWGRQRPSPSVAAAAACPRARPTPVPPPPSVLERGRRRRGRTSALNTTPHTAGGCVTAVSWGSAPPAGVNTRAAPVWARCAERYRRCGPIRGGVAAPPHHSGT